MAKQINLHESPKTFPGHEDEIRELVRRHKVCWEIRPEYHIDRKGKKIQIGFELGLLGTHYQAKHTPEPGCEECGKVYDALKRIAQWIIPKENRDSRYEIGIYDSSIHYAVQRRLRRDIILAIRILHKEGFDRPTDDCEVKCLNEMEEKLKALGAQKGYWVESAKESHG